MAAGLSEGTIAGMSGCEVAGDTWHDDASHGSGGHDRVIVAQSPARAQAVVVDTNQVADGSQERATGRPDTRRRVAG